MIRIVAIMGPAGSGKTVAAEHLVSRRGAKRYSFAAPLKEIAKRTLGFTDAQLYGTQAEKEADDPRYGFSARWFLQRLGTEGCRAVLGPDVWVRACLDQIRREAPPLAVIDDCRFANEAEAVRDAGGRVIRLEAPGRVSSCDSAHASEAGYLTAPYDYLVAPGERGIPLLERMVDDALARYLGGCQ